ncbi:MAG: FliA/WhiG family RNA polymerase sigma factor [Planctomycetota bacterium]|nr:FliA/WhiG family RNA polymerase sigma factor [Planctomycetota bacterium]
MGMTQAVAQLWRDFGVAKSTGAPTLETFRNALIETYLHVVKYAAERARAKLPAEVDVDDLFQAGLFGLMDAINGYDIERGVRFETFADRRIHGAIMDQLRSLDWVPRLVRTRTATMERARKQFQSTQGRPPSEEELQSALGLSDEEFDKVKRDAAPVGVTSLNRQWGDGESGKESTHADVIEDTRLANPFAAVESSDMLELFTRGLSRAESLIVILYYYEEMTMKEIGMTLDLSESRVSQMHSSILQRLKAQLSHRMKELE